MLLAIDTCLNACSAALMAPDGAVTAMSEAMERGQAERLAPLVRETADRAGVALAAVSRVAVTTGPGSFTGVRIGLAFARAFAAVRSIPCVGVSSLEVFAHEAGEEGVCVGVVGVGAGLYIGGYEHGAVRLPPQAAAPADAVRLINALAAGRAGHVRGLGASRLQGLHPDLKVIERSAPDPARLAVLARALAAPKTPPAPLYLRPVQATPKRTSATSGEPPT